MNLRNISWAMGLVLLASVAMPSLARKKKVQPVQKPAVQEDHLSPTDRQRYNYFFLEGARQQAACNYSAAFDLFEHARKIDPKAAETYFYESLFYSQLKQDSLALAYMQKAIELNPENQTYAEQLGRYYIGSQKYDLAIDAYENLYAKNTIIPMPSASWFSFIPRIRIINQYSKQFRVSRWKKVKANSLPSLK